MSSPIDGQFDSHVDEMICLSYIDGQLAPERARELMDHTRGCAPCRQLLAALQRETVFLHESLVEAEEPVPARLLAPSPPEKISWGWMATTGLAAAGLYALWGAVAQPWLDQFRQVGLGEGNLLEGNLLTMLFFSGVFWKGWSDMLKLMEIFSLVIIAVLLIRLLPRNLRRVVPSALVLGVLLLAGLASPETVRAAEYHRVGGETYTLPEGAVVHNDLVVAGLTARIDGTVEGDLVVSARTVTINGHVTGDVIAWAQDVRINGTVDGSCICGAQTLQINGQVAGNVRAFVQVLLIQGSVGKNLMAWSQVAEVSSKGRVGGSLMAFVGSFLADGRIEHDLAVLSEKEELNGFVGGNANLASGRLTLGPQADIRGSASYRGEYRPEVSPQAKLSSPLTIALQSRSSKYSHPRYYWWHVVRLAAAFIFGLVFLLLAPEFFSRAVRAGNRTGAALGFGAVALIATPILAVVACFTLVGIPVGIASLVLYVALLYSSQIFVGAWLGEKILGPAAGRKAEIARLALGLVLLRLCFVIPVVSTVAVCLVTTMGLGAVALAVYNQMGRAARANVIA